jgi:general nucleoside transport system permease protein
MSDQPGPPVEPDPRPEPSAAEEPSGIKADGSVLLSDEEVARQEIEAAKEREAGAKKVALEASFSERLIAALTGTSVIVTLLSFLAAFVLGAFIIAFSDEATREAMSYFFSQPADTITAAWDAISAAYSALIRGSLGGTSQLSETLIAATPLILSGLAVAVPLRAGLFNIGAEGQVVAGGVVAGLVGFSLIGLPMIIHLPLAILGGMLGGALYGFIPGILKARTGAHEVISTIMLNNIALLVSAWLVSTTLFRQPDRTDPVSKTVEASARFPRISADLRVNYSLVFALLLAAVIFWMIERSTRGFELNAVGLNPNAATTAGMSVPRTIVLAMATGGLLGGAAGIALILGVAGRLTIGFSAGIGFNGITVALLGRGRIGGTVAAGLLFGALQAGGRAMQAETGTSLDLVLVLQALIILFIAAPGLVRAIFRVKADDLATGQVAKGWGA